MNNKTNQGYGDIVPPVSDHVQIYFIEKGSTETRALVFFNYFNQLGWKNRKLKPISNWKILAWKYILKDRIDICA